MLKLTVKISLFLSTSIVSAMPDLSNRYYDNERGVIYEYSSHQSNDYRFSILDLKTAIDNGFKLNSIDSPDYREVTFKSQLVVSDKNDKSVYFSDDYSITEILLLDDVDHKLEEAIAIKMKEARINRDDLDVLVKFSGGGNNWPCGRHTVAYQTDHKFKVLGGWCGNDADDWLKVKAIPMTGGMSIYDVILKSDKRYHSNKVECNGYDKSMKSRREYEC